MNKINNHGSKKTSLKQRVLPPLTLLILTIGVPLALYPGQEQKLQSPLVDVVHAQESTFTAPKVIHDVEFTIDQAVDYIWFRESTRGTNNPPGGLAQICYTKGGWDELGFGGMSNPICFKNKEEGFARVNRWIVEHLKKMDIVSALCLYSNGGTGCEYGTTFLSKHTYNK